ncbi:histidine phosphatase family protein [Aestuariimicrobium ganziense]|uniref:hypothetical protein n=1 Tax=Aestuariimicrobium ganziense TaxID=2773677 RepID=UPI001943C39B|nr:hypothetical protein [Aestuariimicrobium ganziense]
MEITLGRRAVLASSTSAPSASTPSLQAALRAGGVTLYLRHPATDRGGVDDAHSPREQQRLLSPEGEQQARDLGGAFERLGATPGRVLTSPSWRCRDAATLAFGRGEVDWGLQALLQDTDTRPERERYGAAMVATVVPDGQVTVLIGHSSNIVAATGVSLPEGGGVLVRGDGERAQVLGALTPTDWAVWASEG